MSEYDEIRVSEWLREGITAAKAGRRDEARELFLRVIEVNEEKKLVNKVPTLNDVTGWTEQAKTLPRKIEY